MLVIKAGVAQLAEQRIRNAQAGGSIPLSGTIIQNHLQYFFNK